MSEIPEDIMQRAREVADQLWLTTHEKADAAKLIALALLAERKDATERAAKVAESFFDLRHDALARMHGMNIAAAIRGSAQ